MPLMYEKELVFTISDPMELYQRIFTNFKCPAHNIKVTFRLPVGIAILATEVSKTDEKAEIEVDRHGQALYWMANGTLATTPQQARMKIEGVKATSLMRLEWEEIDQFNPAASGVIQLIDRAVNLYNEMHHLKPFVWYPHKHGEQQMTDEIR